jgi:uridine kinase
MTVGISTKSPLLNIIVINCKIIHLIVTKWLFFGKINIENKRDIMEKFVKVTFRDKTTKEFPVDTTLAEISHSFQKYYNYPILAAKLDNDLVNLNRTIDKKCSVDFFDRSSAEGNKVYASSANFMLIVAIRRLYGPDVDVKIEHSIDKGVYCELYNKKLNKEVLAEIEAEMHKISEENLCFTRISVSRLDSIKFFKKEKRMDKVNVLKYISNSYINLYRLDDVYDYFFT